MLQRTAHRRTIAAAGLALLLAGIACTGLGGGSTGGGNAVVGDYVWLDANGNGLQDTQEVGVPGVEVNLYTADRSTLVASTVTDQDGKYRFENVEAGEYRLNVDPPEEFDFTKKDEGENEEVDSDVYPIGPDEGWTDPFNLEDDEQLQWDAGLLIQAGPVPTDTPTPIGAITQPTPMLVTPTPDASGSYELKADILEDSAGHGPFVDLGEGSVMEVTQNGASITIRFIGSNPDDTDFEVSGTIGEDGAVLATGFGTAAGFQDVSVLFAGEVTYTADGQVQVVGILTVGADGELPQGIPILYEVSNC